MKTLIRFVITFFILTGVMALLVQFAAIPLGGANYWDEHGLFLILGLIVFPRLTLFFADIPFGGLLGWLGWLFAPRILVAVLATISYWYMNPILVCFAWLAALGGESSEKYILYRSPRIRTHGLHAGAFGRREEKEVKATVIR